MVTEASRQLLDASPLKMNRHRYLFVMRKEETEPNGEKRNLEETKAILRVDNAPKTCIAHREDPHP